MDQCIIQNSFSKNKYIIITKQLRKRIYQILSSKRFVFPKKLNKTRIYTLLIMESYIVLKYQLLSNKFLYVCFYLENKQLLNDKQNFLYFYSMISKTNYITTLSNKDKRQLIYMASELDSDIIEKSYERLANNIQYFFLKFTVYPVQLHLFLNFISLYTKSIK